MNNGCIAYTLSDGPLLINEKDSNVLIPSPKSKLSQVPALFRGSSLQSSIELASGNSGLEVF
jgi:hypothetical protein